MGVIGRVDRTPPADHGRRLLVLAGRKRTAGDGTQRLF
jgi:hypothetical protein